MPYSACEASSSPLTSLSRTAAQLASLDGTMVMPYFLSKPIFEATITEAQSVSGMNPTLTSVFSGLPTGAASACRAKPAGKAVEAISDKAPLRKVAAGGRQGLGIG